MTQSDKTNVIPGITPEEEKYYRLFNPKATQEEIQRFQNKYKKQ